MYIQCCKKTIYVRITKGFANNGFFNNYFNFGRSSINLKNSDDISQNSSAFILLKM